jgi:hypothetical protein
MGCGQKKYEERREQEETTAANTTPDTLIIGISGVARSGKDTIAEMLHPLLDKAAGLPYWGRYSFAEPMKAMLLAGLGVADKEDEVAQQRYDCSYRHLAQTLGTEWGRDQIHKDIWVKIAEMRCRGKAVIISDVRFENEANFVRKYGILIHIERENQQLILECAHKSEAGIDVLHDDYKIINNGNDLDQLKYTVRHAAIDLEQMLAHKLKWKDPEPTEPE